MELPEEVRSILELSGRLKKLLEDPVQNMQSIKELSSLWEKQLLDLTQEHRDLLMNRQIDLTSGRSSMGNL